MENSENVGTQDEGATTMVAPSIPKQETKAVVSQGIYYSPLGTKVRIGSRIIKLEQINKMTSMLPKDPKAKHIRDEVIKKVGSQWKKGTRDIIRGLTRHEEQLYLPEILGTKPDHAEWENRTKNFWANYFISVLAEDGILLEAGFKLKDGSTTEAEPIKLMDYIAYNFCKENSQVAKEDDDNPITFSFRLIDTSKDITAQEETFSLRLIVDRLFIKLINEAKNGIEQSKNIVDWILQTKGGKHGAGTSVYGMTETQKHMELEKIKDRNLKEFESLINDRDLETKALINKAISYSKITQEGNAYFINNVNIGYSLKAAVTWLNDPNNSGEKVVLLEALNQYTK